MTLSYTEEVLSKRWRNISLVVMLEVMLTSTSSIPTAGAHMYGDLEPVALSVSYRTLFAEYVVRFCLGVVYLAQVKRNSLRLFNADYAEIGTRNWSVLPIYVSYMKHRRKSGILIKYYGIPTRELLSFVWHMQLVTSRHLLTRSLCFFLFSVFGLFCF